MPIHQFTPPPSPADPQLLIHSLYSSNLILRMISFVSKLEKLFSALKFDSKEEVIAATNAYLADLQKTYFSERLNI